jgi:YVTN family beta-propeller protein
MKRLWLTLTLTLALCTACSSTESGASARPGSYLAVLNKADATLYIVEPNSGFVKDSAPTGRGPHEAAASNSGRRVVVCNYGDQTPGSTLSVFDLVDRRIVDTIDLSPHQRPHGIVFLDRRSTVLVTSETSRALLEVDLQKKTVVRTFDTGAETSHMVDITPDGKRAFTANIKSNSVSAIDLDSGQLLQVIPTGNGPEAIDVSPDGREVWVGHNGDNKIVILDTQSLEKKGEIACGEVPIRLKFTPDGKHVLVSCANSGELAKIDVRERREIARIPMERIVPADGTAAADPSATNPTPVGLLIDPRGRFAFVALHNAKKIAIVDLETFAVTGHFDVGNQPDGMAWAYRVGGTQFDPDRDG